MAEEKKDKSSAVGSALVGGAIGGQTANAIREILKAKGVMRSKPIKTALLTSGLSVAGIVGGIKGQQALYNRKTRLEEKKAGFLKEYILLTRLV